MKTFAAFRTLAAAVLLAVPVAPTLSAQTATLTGKWEGTFTMERPDGTEGNSNPIVLVLTQNGKDLTGTFGAPDGDPTFNIEKGVVAGGTATFQAQQPNGPLFKFTVAIVKGRLQGEMTGEREGVVRGRAIVDAARAK